jgi:ClpP class serine protease
MSRILSALTAEPWAIEPSWLPLLVALAQRNHSAPEVEAAKGWQARDFDLMVGPGAQRLPGSQRSYVIDGVGIIPIVGPIFPRANMMTEMSGATSITALMADYSSALANTEIGGVVFLQDSPGGAVSGIERFANAVAAGNKQKPTVTHVAGSSASAAYWIASASGEISVERSSLIGSIGVVAALSKQVAPDSDGMIEVEIVSSNAPNKRPDPTTESGSAEVRAMLDAIETIFIGDVARGRNVSTDAVISGFGGGGIKIGAAAKAAGMVDKVQSQEATINGMRRMVANQRKLAALKK